jgi:hypothetical protein
VVWEDSDVNAWKWRIGGTDEKSRNQHKHAMVSSLCKVERESWFVLEGGMGKGFADWRS